MAEEGRVEKFNQLVRAAVVIMLAAGFMYGFIVSKVVSTESYAITFGIAMTWWFASRDKKQSDDAMAAQVKPPAANGNNGGENGAPKP